MARSGTAYPQVEPGAAELMSDRVAGGALRASAVEALDACRRAGARALAAGPGRLVREDELARAVAWGIGGLPARRFAWTRLPVVDASASEIEVRRQFMAGAPMVMVRNDRRVMGLVDRDRARIVLPALSMAAELEEAESRGSDGRLALLRVAGKVGDCAGMATFAVGGFVRDLLLRRRAPDVDLVVEGDGMSFARRLAEEIGGSVAVHAEFGTASIEGTAAGGRVDVASARGERYDRPGALPAVRPAGIAEDLGRRDFSVNAMAVALAPSAFGKLIDPFGGRDDLRRRRLRPLNPLSFVEDPTRIFRAARYAARLGFRLGEEARAALRLALLVADYPALSGQRLQAEVALLARETRPACAFELLLRWGALKLWYPGYRATPRSAKRTRDAARFEARARARGAAVDGADLALAALLIDQPPGVRGACLDRLAIGGGRRDLLFAATAHPVARRLGAETLRPSEVVEMLRPLAMTVLAGAWLRGGERARHRVEWYLCRGRATRPVLSGEGVMALGVPRGPAVGACLAALGRQRVDRRVRSIAGERRFVKRWLRQPGPGTIRARKEGVR